MRSNNHSQTACEAISDPRSGAASRSTAAGVYLTILLSLTLTLFGCIALARSSHQTSDNPAEESTGNKHTTDMHDWRTLSFPGNFPSLLRQDLERAWADIDALTAEDASGTAIAAGEKFLRLAEAAREYTLSPNQEHWLNVRSHHARRIVKAHDFGSRIVHWHQVYSGAETWTRKIAAAEKIVDLLQQNVDSDKWSAEELFEFEVHLDKWQEKLAEARDGYRFRKQDIAERMAEAQTRFIAEQSGHDLQETKALLQSQDRKSFNWRILGRPRDNQELLLVAARRCRRVLDEDRVSSLAYAEAERLYEQAEGRLNRSMRQKLRNRRPLPSYGKHEEYPSASKVEVSLLADWRDFDLDSGDAPIQQSTTPPMPVQSAEPEEAEDNRKLLQDVVRYYFRWAYRTFPFGKI